MHGFDMSIPPPHYVDSEQTAYKWIDRFLQTSQTNHGLGLDSETTGLHKTRDRIIFWSMSDGIDRIAIPETFIPVFKEPLLENPMIDFDLTNAKFDAHMFANSGVDLTKASSLRDTSNQSWLFNENRQGRHGLKDCMADFIGRRTPSFEDTFGKIPPKKIDKKTGRNVNKTQDQIVREAVAVPGTELFFKAIDYASLDAYNSTTLRAYFDNLLAQIPACNGWTLRDYFYNVEVPFTKLLFKLERRGFTVDAGYLLSLKGPMEADMLEIAKEFNKITGEIINLKSAPQMRQLFFDVLKKTPTKWTDGGASGVKQPSTDAEVLEEWAGQGDYHAQRLLTHRGIAKIYGTYVEGMLDHINPPHDFRIHTSLNQQGAVTGRLSSSDPNLQNIPRPGEDKFKIREAFISDFQKQLIVADYAQLEMRLMAHFSEDQKMIDAILNGTDLHCFTVSEMEGIPYDEVYAAVKADKKSKKGVSVANPYGDLGRELTLRELDLLLKRQNAKATGFGIIYGIGGPKLAAQLTRDTGKLITEQGGWDLIRKWLSVFQGVRDYIEFTKEQIGRVGQVQTILGRWRRFGDTRGMSRRDAAQAERQGVNSIIQGTASDIAKMSMLSCEDDPELKALGVMMLLQIHDELVFEAADDPVIIDAAKKRIKHLMEHPLGYELRVPLPVECGSGYTWASAK